MNQHLIAGDRQTILGQLQAEHTRLKAAVRALDARPCLTPGEELERKRLQKLKLHTKDRMTFLASEIH